MKRIRCMQELPLTFDFLLRQGMQALDTQRRFEGPSPPELKASREGEADDDNAGSVLGSNDLGAPFEVIVKTLKIGDEVVVLCLSLVYTVL